MMIDSNVHIIILKSVQSYIKKCSKLRFLFQNAYLCMTFLVKT